MKGFGKLPCPSCLEEVAITLNLETLSECECKECGAEFTVQDVQNLINKWQRVVSALATLVEPRKGKLTSKPEEVTDGADKGL